MAKGRAGGYPLDAPAETAAQVLPSGSGSRAVSRAGRKSLRARLRERCATVHIPVEQEGTVDQSTQSDGIRSARTAFIWASVALGVAAVLFVLWKASQAFLLIFGGMVLAAVFSAVGDLFGKVLPLARRWRVALAVAAIAIVLGVALAFSAQALISQFSQLTSVIDDQVNALETQLSDMGLIPSESEGGLEGLLPSTKAMFGGATQAVLTFFGGVGNVILLVFLGLFFAFEPELYSRGVVSLFPPRHRDETAHAFREAATTLRYWLIGQSISMAVIFVVSFAILNLIGMPFATLLAVQAGLFAFIPLLGPVLAGVPIILAGVSVSAEMALWGLGAYALIQGIESYTVQPIVQERTVALPPALTLSVQLVLGVLFGMLGVALAVPLGATLRTLVEVSYVEGALGGPWKGNVRSDGGEDAD